jgi:hypothetical protein
MTLFGQLIDLGALFTGLSVIVSALGIIASQTYDRRKRRRAAHVRSLETALTTLLVVLERGFDLRERIKWGAALNTSMPSKEIVEFSFQLNNKTELLQVGPFSASATKDQMDKLLRLKEFSGKWARSFSKHLNEGAPLMPLDDLLEEVKAQIHEISLSVRANA